MGHFSLNELSFKINDYIELEGLTSWFQRCEGVYWWCLKSEPAECLWQDAMEDGARLIDVERTSSTPSGMKRDLDPSWKKTSGPGHSAVADKYLSPGIHPCVYPPAFHEFNRANLISICIQDCCSYLTARASTAINPQNSILHICINDYVSLKKPYVPPALKAWHQHGGRCCMRTCKLCAPPFLIWICVLLL